MTSEGYGDFLCAVFDEWIRHDLGRLDVQLFAEMTLVWLGGKASVCWMAPTCGRAIIVEQDGRVYSCDHFVNPDHYLGDLEASPLSALVDLPIQRRFGEEKQTKLPLECRLCSWLEICNGGCPKDRFAIAENGEQGLNYLCGGLGRFFAHAEEPLKRALQLRKQGLTPEAIRAKMHDESEVQWRGVGRNDPCPCGSGRKAKHCCWSKRF